MKRIFLVGVIGLLLLTGCAKKKGDVVCTGGSDGVKMEVYLYLDGDIVTKVDMEYTYDNEDDARKGCTNLEELKSFATFTKKCDGKKITIEDYKKTSITRQATKDEMIGELTRHGDVTCKE